MIKSISIKNFKSFQDASLQFAPLTLLIGANASGKSNAVEAIRLLSWLAKGSRLDDIERNIQGADALIRGQSDDLFNKKALEKSEQRSIRRKKIHKIVQIGCSITNNITGWYKLNLEIGLLEGHLIITDENVLNYDYVELYHIDDAPKFHTDEVNVQYNNFRQGPNPKIPCSNRQAIFYQLETPARFHGYDSKSHDVIPQVCKSFREALRSIVFLDPQPSRMRDYSHAKDIEIKEDGSNLSSVLFSIWGSNALLDEKPLKDYLLDLIRSLPEQDIVDIEFIQTDRNDVMVRLVESFGRGKNIVDAPLLSDGTLRVLSVGGILLTAPEGSLVIIEEMDNGIHPNRANQLIEQIKRIAELRNLHVLITSHNPALLDALPDDALGDVLCCYRDTERGDSRIIQLRDFERFPELAARGPLGQIVTQGILDHYLKNKKKPDEYKNNALEWFANLAKEVGQ